MEKYENKLKLCSFELSKNLKNIEFNWKTLYYYVNIKTPNKPVNYVIRNNNQLISPEVFENHNYKKYNRYSAPELELAAKWFREVHNIYVTIEPLFKLNTVLLKGFGYRIDEIYLGTIAGTEDTYEQALEAALLECCEIVKNKKDEQ